MFVFQIHLQTQKSNWSLFFLLPSQQLFIAWKKLSQNKVHSEQSEEKLVLPTAAVMQVEYIFS